MLPDTHLTNSQVPCSRGRRAGYVPPVFSRGARHTLTGPLLDLYAEHAIGGVIGLIFNALFADSHLIALDGVNTSVPGGWIEHNYKQLYIQVAYVFATCGYSFVVTAIIDKGIDLIPGLALRAAPEMESIGMDDAQVRLRFYYSIHALRTVLTRAHGRSASSRRTTSRCAGTTRTGRRPSTTRTPTRRCPRRTRTRRSRRATATRARISP